MTTPGETPRVRPGVWLAVLALGGLGLMHLGAERAWFVGALETETTANLGYLLRWAIVGMAYGALATFAWSRFAQKPTKKKILLVLVAVSTIMVFGSQVAGRKAMKPLFLAINDVRWDPDTQEFTVHALASPGVAQAHRQGKLQAIASVYGIWVNKHEEWETFAVGPPDLTDYSSKSASQVLDYFDHVELILIRVPWEPDRMDYGTVYPEWVGATLTNQEGKRVGRRSRVPFRNIVFEEKLDQPIGVGLPRIRRVRR